MRNHGLVFFLFMCLTLFGVWALTKMNKDEFPFFTIRQGVVVAVYPGATAQEVEAQVTKPLEDYINGFEEVLPKSSTTIIPNTPFGSEVLRNRSRLARMRLHASLFDLTNIRSDT